MNGWTWLGSAALLSGIVLLGGVTLFGDSRSSDTTPEPMSQSLTDSDMLQANTYARSNNSMQDIENKFVTQNQEGYLASWFATPDIKQDQVLKLQAGYDYATSKGKPFIIDGVYHIKANRTYIGTQNVGLIIRDNSDLRFTPHAKLKLISENNEVYNIVVARDVDNYKISNPHLIGDRLTSKARDGEWGYGLTIYESSNGYIEKPVIENVWGDGIYIGKEWGTKSKQVPTNITVVEPFVSGARRNGLTLASGDNVNIIRPRIQKVGDSDGIEGTWPKACIDVEPEGAEGAPPPRIVNSVIESPTCKGSYWGMSTSIFRDDIEVSLHIKGKTTLSNLRAGVGFYLSGADNTGRILIDELYYKTPTDLTPMSLAWNKASNLDLEINKVTYLHGGADFGITSSDIITKFPGKQFGNVTINNIQAGGEISYTLPEESDFIINGYKFLADEKNSKGISIRQKSTSTSLGGKDTVIGSQGTVVKTGSDISSVKFGNEIWVEPSASNRRFKEPSVSTLGDYRKLKIGLSPSTKTTGNSCNIKGLKIKKANGFSTTAQSKTPDCWIELQNTEGGETKIFDSYGAWTFN